MGEVMGDEKFSSKAAFSRRRITSDGVPDNDTRFVALMGVLAAMAAALRVIHASGTGGAAALVLLGTLAALLPPLAAAAAPLESAL
jgi:hypothetical protein